jgi:hypothetical protein
VPLGPEAGLSQIDSLSAWRYSMAQGSCVVFRLASPSTYCTSSETARSAPAFASLTAKFIKAPGATVVSRFTPLSGRMLRRSQRLRWARTGPRS